MLGIGIGAVHWAKTLMPDNEVSPKSVTKARGSDEMFALAAVEIVQACRFKNLVSARRKLIRRTLYGALALVPIPSESFFLVILVLTQVTHLRHTMWKKGTRLAKDPTGIPIKASDVTLGSVFHVILSWSCRTAEHHKLEEKAKAAVLLVRVDPRRFERKPEERKTWSYDGIVAYSKICTHVGCPVALYEQQLTHNLLCPCHQSTFDLVTDALQGCLRPCSSSHYRSYQSQWTAEGYLIAQSDFLEPVGPSILGALKMSNALATVEPQKPTRISWRPLTTLTNESVLEESLKNFGRKSLP